MCINTHKCLCTCARATQRNETQPYLLKSPAGTSIRRSAFYQSRIAKFRPLISHLCCMLPPGANLTPKVGTARCHLDRTPTHLVSLWQILPGGTRVAHQFLELMWSDSVFFENESVHCLLLLLKVNLTHPPSRTLSLKPNRGEGGGHIHKQATKGRFCKC